MRQLLALLLALSLTLVPALAADNTFVNKEFGFSVVFPPDAKVLPLQESSEGSVWAYGYIASSEDQLKWSGTVQILPVAEGSTDEASMNESLNHGSLSIAVDRKLTSSNGMPALRFSIPPNSDDTVSVTYAGMVVLSRATKRTYVLVALSTDAKKYNSASEAFINSFKVLK